MMDSKKVISLTSTKSVISEIAKQNIEGTLFSEPLALDSPADVLNAPLNPDDITTGLELIKIIFETGTSAIAFALALEKILKENKTEAKVENISTKKEGVISYQDDVTDKVQDIISK